MHFAVVTFRCIKVECDVQLRNDYRRRETPEKDVNSHYMAQPILETVLSLLRPRCGNLDNFPISTTAAQHAQGEKSMKLKAFTSEVKSNLIFSVFSQISFQQESSRSI